MALNVLNILSIDQNKSTVLIEIQPTFYWNDFRLNWNTPQWGGVNQLVVPASSIWKPDITI